MSGDSEAHIRKTLAYVPVVARCYLGGGVAFQELIAAGNLGLVQAALRFDPRRNVKFITYADWWIRKSMLEALRVNGGPIRLPRYQYERLQLLRRARSDWLSRHGASPDVAQLSQVTGFSEGDVETLRGLSPSSVSLEQSVGHAGDRPLSEVLSDPVSECPQSSTVRQDLESRVRSELVSLSDRQRQVIRLRFGLDGDAPMTLREAGRRIGISRERVRQIELRALLELRRRLAPD